MRPDPSLGSHSLCQVPHDIPIVIDLSDQTCTFYTTQTLYLLEPSPDAFLGWTRVHLFGPISFAFQPKVRLLGHIVNPSWCLLVSTKYLECFNQTTLEYSTLNSVNYCYVWTTSKYYTLNWVLYLYVWITSNSYDIFSKKNYFAPDAAISSAHLSIIVV